jgi:protein-tyrosine kinase
MSRVHDALRRAEQLAGKAQATAPADTADTSDMVGVAPQTETESSGVDGTTPVVVSPAAATVGTVTTASTVLVPPGPGKGINLDLLSRIRQAPFTPSPDSHVIDLDSPHDSPAEEFRSLRTRLNHLQSLQPLHSVVVTSASPAEGKSFAAVNLAIAEAQLEGNRTLLIDCDFRRPILHSLFGLQRGPGMTDYLQGKATLEECMVRVGESNLYVITAGEAVVNPLELLNLREMRATLDQLPRLFNWVFLDSPPLLFAADANLLSTMCSGVVMVVRIGTTTIDAVTRAMGSLCEDNTIGIVVNGARRGELYNKYTYYHSYYYNEPEDTKVSEPEHERELE